MLMTEGPPYISWSQLGPSNGDENMLPCGSIVSNLRVFFVAFSVQLLLMNADAAERW